jgi:hypothetical protein
MANNHKKKKKADGTEEAADAPVVGFYDQDQVGPTTGLYDPNNAYGRTPTDPNIGTFEEWLANAGYGDKKKLKPHQRVKLKDEWMQAAGPSDPEYANTPEGEQWTTENQDAHWNYLMAEAGGLATGFGETQFGQYLNSTYKDKVMAGYDAALEASGGGLSYTDYMTSIGWAPGQQVGTLGGGAPRDTGNPYTSTSMPGLSAAAAASRYQAPPAENPFTNNPSYTSGVASPRPDRQRNPNQFARWKKNQNQNQGGMGMPELPDPTSAAKPPTANPTDGLAGARLDFLHLTPQQRGINTGTSFRPGRWAVYG